MGAPGLLWAGAEGGWPEVAGALEVASLVPPASPVVADVVPVAPGVSAFTGMSPNRISGTFWPRFLGGFAPPDMAVTRTGDSEDCDLLCTGELEIVPNFKSPDILLAPNSGWGMGAGHLF